MAKRSMITMIVVFSITAGLASLLWTPDRSLESLRSRWALPPSQFVVVDGVSVHLRDEGPADDPHPIVLIHGTSSSLHTWDGWAAALKERHRVIRFDLPGFGLSASFPDDDYRIEHYTRFTAALLDQLGIRHAILAGNSLGGRIAWETAAARPDLAQRLVLIDSRGYPGEAGSVPLAFRIANVPFINHLVEHVTPRSLVRKSVLGVYGNPARVTEDLVDRYYDLALRAGNRRALVLVFQQQTFTDADRIRTIAIPTLILWGRLDRVVPVANAERFHRDIANSQVVVFDDLGHVPQEEDPAESVKALQSWIADS